MTSERFNFDNRARVGKYPLKALELMARNCDRLVSATNIGQITWESNYDINDVRSLMYRCRGYVRNNVEGYTIYSLNGTSSYILTKTQPIGSFISVPYVMRPEMSIMSDSDINLVYQLEVRKRDVLVRKFSRSQYKLFSFLCDFSVHSEGGYISLKKIAKALFGFDDFEEVNIVRGEILGLKRRMECFDSICVKNARGIGYRIDKK